MTRRARPELLRLGFAGPAGAPWVLGMEPALASALLAALLRRPVPLVDPGAPVEPALLGALSALLVEAARGAGLDALSPAPAGPAGSEVAVLGTVVVSGRPYAAAVWFPELPLTPAPARESAPLLAKLGEATLALPLVVASCVVGAQLIRELAPGAAFLPGAAWSIDGDGVGRGILIAGQSDRGLEVQLGPLAKIVVREALTLPLAYEEDVPVENDAASEPATIANIVLDAPIVVRVELGQVAMPAREWAELRPGDVIGTGRRIAEPVSLRAAGQVLARGELVNLEGELGVRILELVPKDRG